MGLKRLFVVEDDPSTSKALVAIFRHKGWEVVAAKTVNEALAVLDSGVEFCCLVLDLMLPDGDGESILKRVRADRPKTRVAVCTGVADQARLSAVAALQPQALLRKPVSLVEICRVCGAN